MKKILFFLLRTTIVAFIFYYIFRGVDFIKIWKYTTSYNMLGIIITFFIVFLGDILVAYRLHYLCLKKCSYKTSMEASMLSLVANNFIPAKIGEISKIFYLNKKENIKKNRGLSILIFEKFGDIIALCILLISSSFVYLSNKKYYLISIAMLLLCIVFIIFLKKYNVLLKKFTKKIKNKKIKVYFYLFIKELSFNLYNISFLKLIFISLALWLLYVLTNIIFFRYAVFLDIDILKIFTISMIAFAAISLPLTPGGIGTFQAVFIFMLSPYGISKENIIASTFILQLLYILPSLLYLFYMFYISKEIKNVFTE